MTNAAKKELFNNILNMVNDLRPTSLEPIARFIGKDGAFLNSMNDCGHFMKCEETGRYFVPALCV